MTEPTKTETATETPSTATVTTTQKPGWKTSEFWLTKLSMVIGGLLASGLLTSESWLRALGIACVVLSSLGYTVSRTMVKTAAVLALVAFGFHGCATTKAAAGRVAGDVVDCMKPDAKAAIGELAPAFRDIVKNATADNGRVDWAPVRAVAAPLKSAATRCAFTAVIAEVLRPKTTAGAPQSSALEADPADVMTGFEAIRADYFGGATFELGAERL